MAKNTEEKYARNQIKFSSFNVTNDNTFGFATDASWIFRNNK
jgi:hypothetical protein